LTPRLARDGRGIIPKGIRSNAKRRKYMDTEDFTLTETADDLVSAILEDHESGLFDDELEVLS